MPTSRSALLVVPPSVCSYLTADIMFFSPGMCAPARHWQTCWATSKKQKQKKNPVLERLSFGGEKKQFELSSACGRIDFFSAHIQLLLLRTDWLEASEEGRATATCLCPMIGLLLRLLLYFTGFSPCEKRPDNGCLYELGSDLISSQWNGGRKKNDNIVQCRPRDRSAVLCCLWRLAQDGSCVDSLQDTGPGIYFCSWSCWTKVKYFPS